MALVCFNIGWMKYYRGQTGYDRIVNGGKNVAIYKTGGEIDNFKPVDNKYFYGYVRPRNDTIKVEKLSADSGASYANNVTIVFTATHPRGGRRVIGWYRDARVWPFMQTHANGRIYYARAERENSILLPVDKRVLAVPQARGAAGGWGMGQSNVRYVTKEDEKQDFIKLLRRYIKDPDTTNIDPPTGKSSDGYARQTDQEKKRKVEQAAIEHVKSYYKEYSCVSREQDNIGWDLEFTLDSIHLLVEVKGLSGHNATVELTPNEYNAMRRRKHQYRLAIVTNALKQPTLSIVSYHERDKTWRDQNGRRFQKRELMGARITLD